MEEREMEFYKAISRTKTEIEGMQISEGERIKLYDLVNETIQRYEGNKLSYRQGIINAQKLDESWGKLFETLSRISGQSKSILEKTENISDDLQRIEGILEQRGKLLN
ncbi:MAG TPA: hypothetical protein VJ208_00015 [Candidatus Nanoarchaeia archaeon]|nr:hypothetical protein [Candidatus Nanoarchaeia archaeon]